MTYPRLFKDLSNDAATILGLISEASSTKPVAILTIQSEFDRWGEPITARRVKAIVAELRKAGQPVGASRGTPHGYYLISTADQASKSADAMIHQAKSMLLAASRMVPKSRMRELLGQIQIEVEA